MKKKSFCQQNLILNLLFILLKRHKMPQIKIIAQKNPGHGNL